MKKFLFSGFTDEFAPEFDRQVAAAKDFSMDMIELRGADGINVGAMTVEQVKGYAQKLQDAGLGVSAVGSPLGKVKLDCDMDAHMEQVRKICEFANILGTKNIRMFSFYSPEGKSIWDCKNEVISPTVLASPCATKTKAKSTANVPISVWNCWKPSAVG